MTASSRSRPASGGYALMPPLQRLMDTLGYDFADVALLELALTHRSVAGANNERLEFLGDSVLGAVIAEALYGRFPNAPEGDLSRLRASLVKGETLSAVALDWDVGRFLRLGSGELKSGGRRRASTLADSVEAIIGAVYLDAGFAVARERVLAWFASRLADLPSPESLKDPKTRLQEWLQARALPVPVYRLVRASGEDHARRFLVSCSVVLGGEERLFEAEDLGRKKAEQSAARKALVFLTSEA